MDPLELCVTTNKKNPIPVNWRNKGISFYQSNQSLNNTNASVISWPFPHGCNYCNTIMTWSDGILLSLHRIDGPILGPSILGSTRALFLYGSSVMRSQANSSENSASLSPWDTWHHVHLLPFTLLHLSCPLMPRSPIYKSYSTKRQIWPMTPMLTKKILPLLWVANHPGSWGGKLQMRCAEEALICSQWSVEISQELYFFPQSCLLKLLINSCKLVFIYLFIVFLVF